ncbi:MAG: arginine--tRNA ligase [Thermoprotei archaeon]|nr:arginine--tRNA ligase [TACK group archaeon]
MDERSPFATFRADVEDYLRSAGLGSFTSLLEIPPSATYGHLALPLFSVTLPSSLPVVPQESLIAEVRIAGRYLNFIAKTPELALMSYRRALERGERYACLQQERGKIIVEHTSANPLHPMHVGHARNAFLGDSIARLKAARGNKVETHFYVDDMGLQVMIAALGFERAPPMPPGEKPDHWVGFVYAVSNIMYELAQLDHMVKEEPEKYSELVSRRDNLVGYAQALREKHQREFDLLSSALRGLDKDAWEKELSQTLRGMEGGDDRFKKKVEAVVKLALEGFRQTLDKAGVSFDSWDFESTMANPEELKALLAAASASPFAVTYKGTLALNCDAVAKLPKVSAELGNLGLKEIPPMVLIRSDGTSLYETRDIIYSMKKLQLADEVYNVVGAEQTLAQLQVKLALFAIGHPKASHLHHVAYEEVRLPGRKMAGRYGSYVTLDELIQTAVTMASQEIRKRNPEIDRESLEKSARSIGIGAVKYSLLSVSAQKAVEFNVTRALDFDQNSAPFMQYAAVRAKSVLRTAEERGICIPSDPRTNQLLHPLEEELVLLCSRLPDVASYAADSLHVESLASHLMTIADRFNSYYASLPIIGAPDAELRGARLALCKLVEISLESGLSLMGIQVPSEMRCKLPKNAAHVSSERASQRSLPKMLKGCS